ncbi:hypothetical protein LOK49_LG06G01407 [Camellia lanceoleosa]|uniref:Uncharacterized protein n=1 Tax=Camellia lanceoleosa TaxID=1840588 RepID=A0ACC0HKT2_9ERIC|nr:hypothetical protein LOK49_LG06G01407 [Camellia lanceoleosa]
MVISKESTIDRYRLIVALHKPTKLMKLFCLSLASGAYSLFGHNMLPCPYNIFCKLCWQYHRYTPEDEEQDIDELESVRPKSTLRMTSFKDFVDKKEDEVMESIKWKSDSKRQASQRSYRHPSSPSR